MGRVSEDSYRRNRELQRKRNVGSNSKRERSHGRLDYDIRKLERRPFVGWDGEGYNAYAVDSCGNCTIEHRYMLFGCSSGYYESGIDLGTRTCLDLILYTEEQNPDVFHVGFSFEYDVNMILRDLEWRYLAVLCDTGQVNWKGYRIKHIPHKLFSVSKNGISATIFDVFGFFHTSYMQSLIKFNIGTSAQRSRIQAGKNRRSKFTYSEIKAVTEYWSVEISLLPSLMDSLREACYDAGFYITQWHGPGALASFALRKYGIQRYKPHKRTPKAVFGASRFAYAGGRFQAWQCGLFTGSIYTADINSAYAYACSLLPRLDCGEWKHSHNPSVRKASDVRHFALYRISFDARKMEPAARASGIPFPLFHRDTDGSLTWPARTEGWFWSPEAALVAGSKHATFLESWEFLDNGERPFSFVQGAYDRRLQLQDVGNPAEKAYKWFLASIYGQLAQRVGWNRHTRNAPRSHCLEWAGFITSYCRAYVYRAAVDVARRGGLISIDTDGVSSTVPFDPDILPGRIGTGLGEWKLESYSGLLYWQNGIYWLRRMDGEWLSSKARGVPRGHIDRDAAIASFRQRFGNNSVRNGMDGSNPSIALTRSRFIGYRQAMQHRFTTWRAWINEPVGIEFGGSGKGRHIPSLCASCTDARSNDNPGVLMGSHTIIHFPPDHVVSMPHNLPWLAPKKQPETNVKDLGIWAE